jgi:hypothetical protein
MTDLLSRLVLVAGFALVAGCARQVKPTGGPDDLVPPRLVASSPDSGDVNVSPKSVIRLRFTEWIDPATARSTVSLMPVGARTPDIKVDGKDVVVTPREPLDSPSTYVVRIQPGLADWHKAATKELLEIPFATGARIDSGSATVRLWTGSDTTAPVKVKGRLGAWPLDTVYRRSLAKLLRRKDSLGWLRQPPLPWREKPWRWIWADSAGVADLRFLPTGRWRLFAWDDKDKDNFWRPGDEACTWLGDVDGGTPGWNVEYRGRLAPLDTLGAPAMVRDSTKDSLRRRDSLSLDSLDAKWKALSEDSTGLVTLPPDSLPAEWKGAKVRIRVWPAFRRARPRVSAPAVSPRLLLAPGRWSGEIWQDLDDDGKVGVGNIQTGARSEPWCFLPSFEVAKGDDAKLAPDCRIRLPKPVSDTTTLKRANL